MRKVLASSVMVLMVLFLSAGFGLAGNGKGSGTGGGTGPIHEIVVDGNEFTVTGTVDGIVAGGGVEISTGGMDENGIPIIVTIYGIGPVRYWDSLDPVVDRPLVGDSIEASGYVVDSRNIAMDITLDDGTVVQLRDPVTGEPLWRGGSRNSN